MRTLTWRHGLAEPDALVLQQTFDAFCEEEACNSRESVARIKDFKRFKVRELVEAREDIVQRLVGCVSYRDAIRREGNTRHWTRYIRIGTRAGCEGDGGWHQISTPMMAKLFGCDHSTIVLMLGRMRRRAELAELSAQYVAPAPV